MRRCFTYIVASRRRVLYVGMTNDLKRRMGQHERKLFNGFTKRYNVDRLVWYEEFPAPRQAIEAEKRLKGWVRQKKIDLIMEKNPAWVDLSADWFAQPRRTDAAEQPSREPSELPM